MRDVIVLRGGDEFVRFKIGKYRNDVDLREKYVKVFIKYIQLLSELSKNDDALQYLYDV
jgi:hypothetical protein